MASSSPDLPTGKLRLALCQIPVTDSKQDNLATARSALLTARREHHVDLAVLPECFNSPYDTTCFPRYAETVPPVGAQDVDSTQSPSVAMLSSTARETGLYIIGGSIPEQSDSKYYNTSVSVNPHGHVVAVHRKVHLFDIDVPGRIRFRESDTLSPGSSPTTFSTTTSPAPHLNIGVAICYDVRFPELSMAMARAPYHCTLLVFPGAFNMTTGPAHWELLMRARAVDNQCFVAACSPARASGGDGYKAWGHSMVVGPWGDVLGEAGDGEETVVVEVDLDAVAEVRKGIPTGRQRRTDLYTDVKLLK